MRRLVTLAVVVVAAWVSATARAETLDWVRQLGTSEDDRAYGVSADGLGSVYISGWTRGSLGGTSEGDWDAFLAKYGASGMLEWTRQLGTSEGDASMNVSADGLGNVYISGDTQGNLGGTNAGGQDAFLSKYDASGTLEWTRQLGTSEPDRGLGVSADGLGSVYMSGWTWGKLGHTNPSDKDAFVAKFTDLPDPLLGDVNGDGVVNGLDVDPFVDVLLSGPYQLEADMNEDQVVNGLDVDPFVAAMVGGVQQIPEPSNLLLALLALGVVGGWRKWGG
jgi:hypothetical protein